MSAVAVRRALVSVSDKAGLAAFAGRLVAAGVEIVSSGGTAAHLSAEGIPVTPVADVTGAPEILGGRVKTLHPAIHGGILADIGSEEHRRDLEAQDIAPFQLVVVNLYPFEETVARGGVESDAVEQIDIGGPAMIRAAAKNHKWVGAVVSPARYDEVAVAIESGGLTSELRRRLAVEAFFRTAAYDAAIVAWLGGDTALPGHLVLPLERAEELRYGENPHQAAALYGSPEGSPWWRSARTVQGKAMSFNNYADAEAAWRLVNDLKSPAAVIVKHTNACGAAEAADLPRAFRAAWDCDPLSAFGGVVALNESLDPETAAQIAEYFVEVVIALDITDAAAAALAGKKNLRVLTAPPPRSADLDMRRLEDGLLIQERDGVTSGGDEWQVMSGRGPTDSETAGLRLAWTVAAHTKSNAIVVAKEGAAVGIGAGDQSRVGAAERALARAGDRAGGAVAASDAFFPFRDGIDALSAAGVSAVIEPGGSVRDGEIVAACDEHGMALVFTGRRHFRH
jgi:phosphoribosylaminoimidazolecarboxamide formyltransferase/IMP cyclohydrolase